MYMDDMVIATRSIEENLNNLKKVLIVLKQHGFELNLANSQFLKFKIEYLGYIVSQERITMSDRHKQAISDFPILKTVRHLQGSFGLTNYFRRFIRGYAKIAQQLHKLTKKSVNFVFDEEYRQSFQTLKKELTSYLVLRLYNPAAETELYTDTSESGFGAILLQKQADGKLAPIAYFSKATSDVERKYHSYELETFNNCQGFRKVSYIFTRYSFQGSDRLQFFSPSLKENQYQP